MWVWFLDWENFLEEETATLSSILAWKMSWTEDPGELQSVGSQRVRHDWAQAHTLYLLNFYLYINKYLLNEFYVLESSKHRGFCSIPNENIFYQETDKKIHKQINNQNNSR